MKRYGATFTGLSPLLMHRDNLAFGELISKWRKDPANKEFSQSGDDRSPAWTWLGYVYHNSKVFGISSDNIMTMFREGGAKVINKGKETYKKQTQSGIFLDQEQFTLTVKGKEIPVDVFDALRGNMDFTAHMELAASHGFELLVKRAKIGNAKHVRVRPMFRDWVLTGSFTVIDEDLSGLSKPVLETILNQAGALCGLGDWRPSSPKSSGTFGRFSPEIRLIK